MSNYAKLNCLGQKCPRPIIEIVKLARKSPPGTILMVTADDLAFESDVRAWVERAQATLITLEKDGDQITAQIRLPD